MQVVFEINAESVSSIGDVLNAMTVEQRQAIVENVLLAYLRESAGHDALLHAQVVSELARDRDGKPEYWRMNKSAYEWSKDDAYNRRMAQLKDAGARGIADSLYAAAKSAVVERVVSDLIGGADMKALMREKAAQLAVAMPAILGTAIADDYINQMRDARSQGWDLERKIKQLLDGVR